MEIYVETSVWSFAFADDAPDYCAATLRFFEECRRGMHRPLISSVVLEEISRTTGERLDRLRHLVQEIRPAVLPLTPAAEDLARAFLDFKAVPGKKADDARHVAVAFVEAVPALVSWNFKHIANMRRADRFNAVAVMQGYSHILRIVSPPEVLYEP